MCRGGDGSPLEGRAACAGLSLLALESLDSTQTRPNCIHFSPALQVHTPAQLSVASAWPTPVCSVQSELLKM